MSKKKNTSNQLAKKEELAEALYAPMHTRFSAAEWFENRPVLTIVGAGNIGSWLIMILTKCGYDINLYEHDVLEPLNIGPQLYPMLKKPTSKGEATKKLVELFSDSTVNLMGKFTEESPITDSIIVAVDNMPTRKLIFEKWKKNESRLFLLDGRTYIDAMQVITVTRKTEEEYEKDFIFEDDEVEAVDCALRSFPYVGALIAGLMSSTLTNIYSNINIKKKLRKVPFFQAFQIPRMTYENR